MSFVAGTGCGPNGVRCGPSGVQGNGPLFSAAPAADGCGTVRLSFAPGAVVPGAAVPLRAPDPAAEPPGPAVAGALARKGCGGAAIGGNCTFLSGLTGAVDCGLDPSGGRVPICVGVSRNPRLPVARPLAR